MSHRLQDAMSTAIADIEYDLRATNLLINNDRSHHVRTSRNSTNSTENGTTTHVAIHCASELVHYSEHLRHVLLPSVEEEYVNLAVRERALTSRLTSARSRLQLLQSLCTLSKRDGEEDEKNIDTCKERGGDGAETKRSSGSGSSSSSNSSSNSSSVRSKILQLLVNDEIALLKWHQAKVEYETRRKRNVVPLAKQKKEKQSDDDSNGGGHLLSQWFACFAEAGAKLTLELKESRRRNSVDVGTREKNATATTANAMVAEKEVVEEVLDVVVEVEVEGVERMMSGCQPAVEEEAAVVPPTINEMVDMPCFMVRASTLQRGQKKGKKGTQQQQQQWSMQFRSRVKDTTVIVRLIEETKEVVEETNVGAVRIRMEIEPREALATGKNVSSSHSMSASVWLSEHVPSVEATIMFVKEIVRPLLRVEEEEEEEEE